MNALRQFTVLLVAMAIGLGACPMAVDKTATVKSEFAFLKKLGISPARGIVLLDSLDRECNIDFNDVLLLDRDEQALPLLGKVIDVAGDPNQVDVMNYLVGVKALPGNYTLAAFERVYAESMAAYVGIYDAQGELIDFMNCGTWFQDVPLWEEGDSFNAVYRKKALLKFGAPGEFYIERCMGEYTGSAVEPDFRFAVNGCRWEIKKTFRYMVDAAGHIVLMRVVCNKSNDVTADASLRDKIDEIARLPLSAGKECLDRINRLATYSEQVRLGSGNADACNGLYDLAWLLSERYTFDPQLVLAWVASHRDVGKYKLTRVFKFIYEEGILPKDGLVKDTERMRDPEARRYIEQLTAQWGPRYAVG